MIDRYTKSVLTIIAAALILIVVQHAAGPAQAQISAGCGESSFRPCFIKGDVTIVR